jgi:hypothetical protein
VITIVDPVKHQPVPPSTGQVTSTTPEVEPQDQRYYVFDEGMKKTISSVAERRPLHSQSLAW